MSPAAMRAVALMGPTGTGKSALAMELAVKSGSSIVACDSMQVYRGLDIGTAKPDAEDRARVRHHMIDCAGLPEAFSAARWAEQAAAAIAAENEAGVTPLICGGTGLYLRALLQGLAEIPGENEGVRRRLTEEMGEQGAAALHARLAKVDAETAKRLNPNDTQRILRALTVFESSGIPLSRWTEARSRRPAIDCPVFVLAMDRMELRDRLASRFHAMLAAGWLDEVRWLASLGLSDRHPAVRAVGYRQLLAHVRGEVSLDEAAARGIQATRQYAKRQETWFRHQTADACRGDAETLAPDVLRMLRP